MAARHDGSTAARPRKSSAKRPSRPADLRTAGKATWALLWTLPQIVWPDDELPVTRLCRVEDEMSALRSALLEQGSVLQRPIQTPSGKQIGTEPVVHPALLAVRRLGAEAGEICSALGIGPNARHTLGLVIAEPAPDGVDELKDRRRKRRAAAGIV
jgi:P27 family predicted phage terminase small subunit